MSHTYEYPRPSLTVDVVLYRWRGGWLEVLLIERAHDPFAGRHALPGGFVDAGETPEDAARRELLEETGVRIEHLVPVACFGGPGRDPRGWVVSSAYLGLAPSDTQAVAGDDARRVGWHRVGSLPEMAFDHAEILAAARQRLQELTQTSTLPLSLLPLPLRTRHARFLYSQILGEPIKPAPFKAWLRRREVVERVGPAKFQPRAALRPDWLR
ncbi:MAG: NUDIX hydrolase [bacterium]